MGWSSYHAVLLLEAVRATFRWTLEETSLRASASGVLLCLEGLLLAWALGAVAPRFHGKECAAGEDVREKPVRSHNDTGGHVEFVLAEPCGPSRTPFRSSSLVDQPFETEVCTGKFLLLHKPTTDVERMQSGNYPYASHLHGRKRNFEARIQIRLKDGAEEVGGGTYFGCGLDRFYKIGAIELYLGKTINGMIKKLAVGMHQSYGDDPDTCKGELELPCNVYPLWVMDQIIETPEGDEPPDLCSAEFPTLGMIKTDDRQKMRERLDTHRFLPGITYTLAFWCVSPCVDAVKWRAVLGGLLNASLSDLGTHPPAYLSMYRLRPREQWTDVQGEHDNRHLESRKVYLFRCALWSSLYPPSSLRVKELTANDGTAIEEVSSDAKKSRSCCDLSAFICS
jgi:hypothetical protein